MCYLVITFSVLILIGIFWIFTKGNIGVVEIKGVIMDSRDTLELLQKYITRKINYY
jgi:hypothetical protein